jgi:hypothetical protein
VTVVLGEAATLADRCPISAPGPTASDIVCEALGEGVGWVAPVGAGAGLAVAGVGLGPEVAATELTAPAGVEGEGEGVDSTADANPVRPGPASRQLASTTTPIDFRVWRRD